MSSSDLFSYHIEAWGGEEPKAEILERPASTQSTNHKKTESTVSLRPPNDVSGEIASSYQKRIRVVE